MTITTIHRVHFSPNEFPEQVKFEQESPQYKKISEDSSGTTYEYRTDYIVNFAERREE